MSLIDYSEEELEAEINRRKEKKNKKIDFSKYTKFKSVTGSPSGLWEVKTEADCEGRSEKSLGIFQGHILDIAAMLAPQQYYNLNFKKLDNAIEETKSAVTPVKVNICFDIKTGLWDMKLPERVNISNKFFLEESSKFGYFFYINSDSCPYAGVEVTIIRD